MQATQTANRLDGQKLRAFRLTRGLTQRQVAADAGMTVDSIGRIELGGAAVGVQERTIYRLASALGVPPSELTPELVA
jgi:transcriptional regulator with XRE-family HTH domain